MTPRLTDELRLGLRETTANLVAEPTMLDDVLRRARRQSVTKRATVAVAAAVAVLVPVGAVALTGGPQRSDPVAGSPTELPAADRALLNRPTRGEFAGDDAYLRAVLATWARAGATRNGVGRPHVVWAGRTPFGRAAVVAQETAPLAGLPGAPRRRVLLLGVAGDNPARDRINVAEDAPVGNHPRPTALLVPGTRDRTAVVVERGRAVQLSPHRLYTEDGRVHRRWAPVPFAEGVALLEVSPAELDSPLLRISGEQGTVGLLPERRAPAAPMLDWPVGGGIATWPVGDRPSQAWSGHAPGGAEARSQLIDAVARGAVQAGDMVALHTGRWFGYGSTADGSRLLVGEYALGADPSRVAVVLRDPAGRTAMATAMTRPGSMLPVVVELPRGQGWLVARAGLAIQYRVGTGTARPAGRDAALLPAAATEAVLVTPDGPTSIPLN